VRQSKVVIKPDSGAGGVDVPEGHLSEARRVATRVSKNAMCKK
jgi:hypothetical protein